MLPYPSPLSTRPMRDCVEVPSCDVRSPPALLMSCTFRVLCACQWVQASRGCRCVLVLFSIFVPFKATGFPPGFLCAKRRGPSERRSRLEFFSVHVRKRFFFVANRVGFRCRDIEKMKNEKMKGRRYNTPRPPSLVLHRFGYIFPCETSPHVSRLTHFTIRPFVDKR